MRNPLSTHQSVQEVSRRITSIDRTAELKKAVKGVSFKMPLLTDPSCSVSHTYEGQALGALQLCVDKQATCYKDCLLSLVHTTAERQRWRYF